MMTHSTRNRDVGGACVAPPARAVSWINRADEIAAATATPAQLSNCVRGAVSDQGRSLSVTQFTRRWVATTMNTTSLGAAHTAAGLSRMTLMRPFPNLIENLERIGVQYVVFHASDGQDHQIHISAWREEHVFQGIRINGRTLCPNVTSAFLNPFLPQPILVVTCESIPIPDKKKDGAGDEDRSKVTAVVAESVPDVTRAESNPSVPTPVQAKVHSEAITVVDKADEAERKGEKRKGGSSCHQCKNVKTVEGLIFCKRKFDRRHRSDKRNCRKKYCPHCLMKFYNIGPDSISSSEWYCPSCSGICRCAACARSSLVRSPDLGRPNETATTPTAGTPSTDNQ